MPRNLSDTISGAAIAPISHNPIHCLFKFLNWVQESLLFHPILLDITKKVLINSKIGYSLKSSKFRQDTDRSSKLDQDPTVEDMVNS